MTCNNETLWGRFLKLRSQYRIVRDFSIPLNDVSVEIEGIPAYKLVKFFNSDLFNNFMTVEIESIVKERIKELQNHLDECTKENDRLQCLLNLDKKNDLLRVQNEELKKEILDLQEYIRAN